MKKIVLDDGKYEYQLDEKTGLVSCLRHGEPWQMPGDIGNSVCSLVVEFVEMRERLRLAQNAIVDALGNLRQYTPAEYSTITYEEQVVNSAIDDLERFTKKFAI